jgi:cytochrome bd-type quinol oxidase subunit 2
MKQIKKILILLTASTVLLIPNLAYADNPAKEAIQCGVNAGAGLDKNNCQKDTGAANKVNKTIKNFLNLLSIVAGIAAVLMFIVGGFMYLTSAGNEQTVTTAKKTLTYALIGLFVIVLAQAIVRVVIQKVVQ